jgi:hypothetical protein
MIWPRMPTKPGADGNEGLFLLQSLPRRCYRSGAAAFFTFLRLLAVDEEVAMITV